MVAPKQHVLDQALRLPPADRRELAESLLDSLDDEALHPDWEAEIRRRVEALDRGELELLDGDEVLRRLKERYPR